MWPTANVFLDGFILDKNESDCIFLDDIVFRDITSPDKQEELWLNQYYGYVLWFSRNVHDDRSPVRR